MSRAVYYHVNRTEVSFVKDGTPKTVSMAPYLQDPDSSAIIVACWQDGATPQPIRVGTFDSYSGPVACLSELRIEGLLHVGAVLVGSNKNVVLAAGNDDVHVAIVAELRGPDIVTHNMMIEVGASGPSEINAWINRSVTLEGDDQASDVKAVLICAVRFAPTDSDRDWCVRGLGSTHTRLWANTSYQALFFTPSAAPDGEYQFWQEGKVDPFAKYTHICELGYVKDGASFEAILNPLDENPATSATWQTDTAGPRVRPGADGIFAVQALKPNGGGDENPKDHGLRAIGSTNGSGWTPFLYAPFDCGCAVRLNDSKQYEYLAASQEPETWILAYTMIAEASGSATVKLAAQGDAISAAIGTSSAILKGVASGDFTLPADLEATIAMEDVIDGSVAMADVLDGEPTMLDILDGAAAALDVLDGQPAMLDVLDGTPATPAG